MPCQAHAAAGQVPDLYLQQVSRNPAKSARSACWRRRVSSARRFGSRKAVPGGGLVGGLPGTGQFPRQDGLPGAFKGHQFGVSLHCAIISLPIIFHELSVILTTEGRKNRLRAANCSTLTRGNFSHSQSRSLCHLEQSERSLRIRTTQDWCNTLSFAWEISPYRKQTACFPPLEMTAGA